MWENRKQYYQTMAHSSYLKYGKYLSISQELNISRYQYTIRCQILQNATCVKLGDCRTCCSHKHATWYDHISNFEDVMNSLQHSSTSFSPHEIMFRIKPDNLISELVEFPPCIPITMQEHEAIVKETIIKQGEIRKRRRGSKVKITRFNIWDQVLVRSHSKSKMLNSEIKKFFDIYVGLFDIVENPHPNAYRVAYAKYRKIFGLRNVVSLKIYKHKGRGNPQGIGN